MYEKFFSLREEPFKMSPNPKFLFLSQRHVEALSCLAYGIEARKGFVQVTGEVGAGKTTICRSYLANLPKNVKYALIFNPVLSEVQILKTIIDDFGIKGSLKGKKDYFDAINTFLLEQNAKGYNCVLFIDEAQNLEVKVLEQLRLLSNLETENEKLLQIIFLAQPEFRETLKQPELLQLRQRVAIRYHLRALDLDETADYVYHRLHIAGAPKHSITITRRAFSLIYEYSHGVPRVINIVCDKMLMAAYVAETKQITYQIIEQAIQEVEGSDEEESEPFSNFLTPNYEKVNS